MPEIKKTIENEQRKEKTSSFREKKMRELIDLRDEMTRKYGEEFLDAVCDWDVKVRALRSDFLNCELFYMLIRDKKEHDCSFFDFDDECSVEKFLEEWAGKKEEISEPEKKKAA